MLISSKRTALAVFGYVAFSAASASPAVAALYYSESNDFGNAVALDGATVPAGRIFVGNDDSRPLDSLDCCDWISGPGAGVSRSGQQLSGNSAGLVEVDLSALPAGSVRRASGGGQSASFTVDFSRTFNPVSLTPSGPVTVTSNGAVIENLSITTDPGEDCAVRVNDVNNVTLRNLDIDHANVGICVQGSSGLRIEGVRLNSNSTPNAGPHCNHGVSGCKFDEGLQAKPNDRLAIKLDRVSDARIDRVETVGASSGIYVLSSPGTRIYDVVCKDARGPFPRGQCVQFIRSNDSSLSNFYSKIWKDRSHAEDNINMYESDRVVVQDGLVDGNYSIRGVGVIADAGSDDAVVRNIDLMHTAVSAVSVYSYGEIGRNFLAENIRVKDTSCVSRDGGTPSSGGLVVAIQPGAQNARFLNVQYFNHCRSFTAYCLPFSCSGSTGTVELREENFTPREPLQLKFAWDAPERKVSCPVINDVYVMQP